MPEAADSQSIHTTYGAFKNGTQTAGEASPQLTNGVTNYFRNQERRASMADLFSSKLEETQVLFNESNAIGISLDLDGVVIKTYEEDGRPHLDGNVSSMSRFYHNTKREVERTDKKFFATLNTNRELPIVKEIMTRLDPMDEQKSWWAVLEGGHTLAYRHQFSPGQIETVTNVNGSQIERVMLPDGTYAHVMETYRDGSKLVLEKLIDTSAAHKDIRVGQNGLTLGEARNTLVNLFVKNIQDQQLGDAYIPDGRYGMVTVRGIDESLVKPEGTGSLAGVKKYKVSENSPIAKMVLQELGIASLGELHATMYYYPGDKGFDIQFDGFSKQNGQELMVNRMRQLGFVGEEDKVAIAHIGDSGSDKIPFESKNLKNVVIAVDNADDSLVEGSHAQTPYAYVKGVKHTLYLLQQLAMKNISPQTIERFKDESFQGTKNWVEAYLGRENPKPGDIDLGEILKRVDTEQLERVAELLSKTKETGGRVFVYGNGGSYDNSTLIADTLSKAGVVARTPADAKTYITAEEEKGYSHIFVDALKKEKLNPNDIVIGVSGSGNSPNVLLAHDYAFRIRMDHIRPQVNQLEEISKLQGRQYNIDTSVMNLPTLAEDPNSISAIEKGIKNFETSLQQAIERAQAANDTEALGLLTTIEKSQNIISFGGRDGGKMKKLTGDTFTVIAPTQCMEALEDVHPDEAEVLKKRINGEATIEEAMTSIRHEVVDLLRRPDVLNNVTKFVASVEKAIFTPGSRLIIVGSAVKRPSITHMAADFGRGAINMLPIAGPEISYLDNNLNAMMATANDDGADYVYSDQLSKIQLDKNHIIVFIGGASEEKKFTTCMEMVQENGAQSFVIGSNIGERKADVPLEDENLLDLVSTSIIHTTSRATNEHIRSPKGFNWEVAEADTSQWDAEDTEWMKAHMGDQRKLNKRDTMQLEERLRGKGKLAEGKVIVFTYGKAYLADAPEKYGLPRGFY